LPGSPPRPGAMVRAHFTHVLAGILLIGGSVSFLGCATVVAPSEGTSVSSTLVESPLMERDPAPREAHARILLIRGMTRAFLGDHAGAIELYEHALRLVPAEPALYAAIAEAYSELGDLNAARYHARQGSELAAKNLHYREALADLHARAGDLEAAMRIYQEILSAQPAHLGAHQVLARIQADAGLTTQALVTYERMLELVGESAVLRYQMLHLYERVGDHEGVLQSLAALIALDPADATLRHRLSETYQSLGRHDEAVRVLEDALLEMPHDVEVGLRLGELHRSLGREERADEVMALITTAGTQSPAQLVAQAAALLAERDDSAVAEAAEQLLILALEREPGQDDALALLGMLRLESARYGEAGDLLYQAARLQPRHLLRWKQSAAAFLEDRQPDRAAAVADEALFLFPGQLDLLRYAGYAWMDLFENEVAIARFDELVNLLLEDAPHELQGRAEALTALALLHDRNQNVEASDSCYQLALAADPDHPVALNNYAYRLAERGDRLDEALEMAQRAVAIMPENASFLDTLGWVYFVRGDYAAALKWIREAVDTGDAGAAIFEHLGDIQERLGNAEDARRSWEQALHLGAPEPRVLRKLEALQP
jgi:tetratricopeptide (TPR) repeat protein